MIISIRCPRCGAKVWAPERVCGHCKQEIEWVPIHIAIFKDMDPQAIVTICPEIKSNY
jgi:hypothetical protein